MEVIVSRSLKQVLFGNPFKKGTDSKFGMPKEEDIYAKVKKVLEEQEFTSREEASKAYSEAIKLIYFGEYYFTIKVRCPNCLVEGTVRLEKGVIADNAQCPRCEVDGLEVLGLGSTSDTDIINSPLLSEELEDTIKEKVHDATEAAWSLGRISRGTIFE